MTSLPRVPDTPATNPVHVPDVAGPAWHLRIQLQHVGGMTLLPDHNYLLGSAIYARLRDLDGEHASWLHDNRGRTPYVVSELSPRHGEPGSFNLSLGTTAPAVARCLADAIGPAQRLVVGRAEFMVECVESRIARTQGTSYRTLSPILIRPTRARKCLTARDSDYAENLQGAIDAQVETYLGEQSQVRLLGFEPRGISVRPLKGGVVHAQRGNLEMTGPSHQLHLLLGHGIGNSPGLAFGMIAPCRNPNSSG